MKTVYVGLGSNMGNSPQLISEGIRFIAKKADLLSIASLYVTEPQDYIDQSHFYNTVLACKFGSSPGDFLGICHEAETHANRIRIIDKGPRTLDVDILLFGEMIIETDGLTIPHPRMKNRRFVLEPLVEIQSDLHEPGSGIPFDMYLKRVRNQAIYEKYPLAYNWRDIWNRPLWKLPNT